jgi:hypothetical protein
MTYPYAGPAEEQALAAAAARGLAGPPQPRSAMTERGDSPAASCAAEVAQLERARCPFIECRGEATEEDLEVVVLALSTVAKRSRQARRSLEHGRSGPMASRTVRP